MVRGIYSRGRRQTGFTLIELLIAITLLIMIVLVASYIFDTTVKTVSQTEANNELYISLQTFAEQIRYDLRGMQHGGFFVVGRRDQGAFGSTKDRTTQRQVGLRNDWLMLFTNTEQYSQVDPRAIGQWARIFYGHGQTTDRTSNAYSNIGTDWVLMRHQILLLAQTRIAAGALQATLTNDWDKQDIWPGLEHPYMGDYVGHSRQYTRSQLYPWVRDFRWHWMMNYGWAGTVTVPYGDGGQAYYEPTYYQTASFYYGWSQRRFQVLPHCAHFAIQYAMPSELNAEPGGSILWRDPPAVGDGSCPDPNYNANLPDPAHKTATIPASGTDAGRLSFAPGDVWPALLRINVQVFDPMDRLEGGKKMSLVVQVP